MPSVRHFPIAVVSLVFGVLAPLGGRVASAGYACCPSGAYYAGEIFVSFDRNTPNSQSEAEIRALGLEIRKYPGEHIHTYFVAVPVGSEDDVATSLRTRPGVQSAGKIDQLCIPEAPRCDCCPRGLLCDGLPLCAGRCQGDCNSDGRISIAELVTSVKILLGGASIDSCEALNLGEGSTVDVGDLVFARNGSLYGCSGGQQ